MKPPLAAKKQIPRVMRRFNVAWSSRYCHWWQSSPAALGGTVSRPELERPGMLTHHHGALLAQRRYCDSSGSGPADQRPHPPPRLLRCQGDARCHPLSYSLRNHRQRHPLRLRQHYSHPPPWIVTGRTDTKVPCVTDWVCPAWELLKVSPERVLLLAQPLSVATAIAARINGLTMV